MSYINSNEYRISKPTQYFIFITFSILIFIFFLSGLVGLYINKKNIEINFNEKVFKQFEDLMDKNYLLANKIKPNIQEFLLLNFSEGNKKVHIGKDNHLFFKEDTQTLINKNNCNNLEIIKKNFKNLNQFLKRKKVDFYLGILPTKSQIMHNKYNHFNISLKRKYKGCYDTIPLNLEKQGLMVFNLEKFYKNLKHNNLFLKYDSHWSFDTMEAFSKVIADTIKSNSQNLNINYIDIKKNRASIKNYGDLYDMLDINDNFKMQEIFINQIESKDHNKIVNDTKSNVVLIGDSFTNIYSDETLNWGTKSGLAYQLAYRLKGSINSFASNGSAFKTALMKNFLSAEKLKEKSVMILIMTQRELRNIRKEIDFNNIVLDKNQLKISNDQETILITKESEFSDNFTPYKNVLIVHEALLNNKKILVVTWAIKNRKKLYQLKLNNKIKVSLIPFSQKIKLNPKLSSYMMIDETNNYESEMYWIETMHFN